MLKSSNRDPETDCRLEIVSPKAQLPSRQESLPLVTLEAAPIERPVVASCLGGLPEVVLHERTGILVDPEDSRSSAGAIVYLLSHFALGAKIATKRETAS